MSMPTGTKPRFSSRRYVIIGSRGDPSASPWYAALTNPVTAPPSSYELDAPTEPRQQIEVAERPSFRFLAWLEAARWRALFPGALIHRAARRNRSSVLGVVHQQIGDQRGEQRLASDEQ